MRPPSYTTCGFSQGSEWADLCSLEALSLTGVLSPDAQHSVGGMILRVELNNHPMLLSPYASRHSHKVASAQGGSGLILNLEALSAKHLLSPDAQYDTALLCLTSIMVSQLLMCYTAAALPMTPTMSQPALLKIRGS